MSVFFLLQIFHSTPIVFFFFVNVDFFFIYSSNVVSLLSSKKPLLSVWFSQIILYTNHPWFYYEIGHEAFFRTENVAKHGHWKIYGSFTIEANWPLRTKMEWQREKVTGKGETQPPRAVLWEVIEFHMTHWGAGYRLSSCPSS